MQELERRRSKRRPLRFPLCRVYPEPGGFHAVKNISETGALVVGQFVPLIGEDIEIWIQGGRLPDRPILGRVVRHELLRRSQAFAVAFLAPAPRAFKAAVEQS